MFLDPLRTPYALRFDALSTQFHLSTSRTFEIFCFKTLRENLLNQHLFFVFS